MRSFAILNDVTRCIGCEECVVACKQANGLAADDAPWKWQDDAHSLSAMRWTTIQRTPEGQFVREQCRHCLEPACVEACPVKALYRTPQGVVAYNPDICLGCRYCILACAFRATRFEYGSPSPRVGKCTMCYEALTSGRLDQPACTAACPTGATIFGERDELIREARARIASEPQRYIDHIWGEHEGGGTSVLYLAGFDLQSFGWPSFVTEEPLTHLTHTIMHTVPFTFLGMCAVLGGTSWFIKRRQRLAREARAGEETVAPDTPAEDQEETP